MWSNSDLEGCEYPDLTKARSPLSSRGNPRTAILMLSSSFTGEEHIYLAFGATDFRKQAETLVAMVIMRFQLDPYSPACVFLFSNKNKTAIKVLRYDKNGFILARKKLLKGMSKSSSCRCADFSFTNEHKKSLPQSSLDFALPMYLGFDKCSSTLYASIFLLNYVAGMKYHAIFE